MNKETKLEELERKISDIERHLNWNREGDVRMWKAIQTICKYLNIQLDENVVGIMIMKEEKDE